MNGTLSFFAGFLVGVASLMLAYRRDGHHVRLELTPLEYGNAVLGVNNDSGCAFGVISVGHFNAAGEVKWMEGVGSYVTNSRAEFPIRVEPRSLSSIQLVGPRNAPSGKPHGYCVQLETGRIYVLRNSAPFATACRMHITSLVSRLARGAWVPGIVSRPRLPTRE